MHNLYNICYSILEQYKLNISRKSQYTISYNININNDVYITCICIYTNEKIITNINYN